MGSPISVRNETIFHNARTKGIWQWCGTVDSAVDTDTRGPVFESITGHFIEQLFNVNCS